MLAYRLDVHHRPTGLYYEQKSTLTEILVVCVVANTRGEPVKITAMSDEYDRNYSENSHDYLKFFLSSF